MDTDPQDADDHERSDRLPPLVLVTGGSGLLGSALIDELVRDHRVVSLDLDGDARSRPTVEFICTDLTDDESVGRAFERIGEVHPGPIASVVHLAAYYDFAGRDSPLYDKITVEGTRRLLDALRQVDVQQFVFSSTMLVHRPTEVGDEVDESDPIEKSWPYPASKVKTEAVIRDHPAHSGMSTVVVRIAGVYDEDGHSPPITNQIKRIDGRWPTSHFYPADLATGQAFVHLDDAVDALARVVRRRDELPDWFPVLVGEPETVGYGRIAGRHRQRAPRSRLADVPHPGATGQSRRLDPREEPDRRRPVHSLVDGRPGIRQLRPRHLVGARAAWLGATPHRRRDDPRDDPSART